MFLAEGICNDQSRQLGRLGAFYKIHPLPYQPRGFEWGCNTVQICPHSCDGCFEHAIAFELAI